MTTETTTPEDTTVWIRNLEPRVFGLSIRDPKMPKEQGKKVTYGKNEVVTFLPGINAQSLSKLRSAGFKPEAHRNLQIVDPFTMDEFMACQMIEDSIHSGAMKRWLDAETRDEVVKALRKGLDRRRTIRDLT